MFEKIKQKYAEQGENYETYLQGLFHTKPLTYWDYVELETLLSLQRPRTNFKDEEIFIMYHQVTELFLKLILHEIKQVVEAPDLTDKLLSNKLTRIIRYTEMLITSFDIMKDGMDYDDYNTFRAALAPASGFQSVQFRYIELYCTPILNLINETGKTRLPINPTMVDYFHHIYWKDAGYNRKTGEKTITLSLFEEKYQEELMQLAEKLTGRTLAERIALHNAHSDEVIEKLRTFDHLYNVVWPMVHLNTARHYLDSKQENQQATGGSEWKKYLHPKFQQRRFFPNLWTTKEKESWGHEEHI